MNLFDIKSKVIQHKKKFLEKYSWFLKLKLFKIILVDFIFLSYKKSQLYFIDIFRTSKY